MKPSLTLIINPAAKRASERRIQKAVRLLESAGYDAGIFITRGKGDAEYIARKASEAGESLIIAAGGDGTFNEVINGIALSQSNMAILPMGTTNVLAKELGIPEDIEGAVRRILNGNTHNVSLGSITLTHHSPLVTRYFCLMAGIGFDGEAVYNINESLKRYSGKGSYILSGLKILSRYFPEPLTLIINGDTCTGYSAIIGNASKYGGNFRVTPDATLLKPELYVFVMHGKKRSDIIRYLWGIFRGTHIRFKDITYLKALSIEIKGDARIQIDGDYFGSTPAAVTVVPNALRLIF